MKFLSPWKTSRWIINLLIFSFLLGLITTIAACQSTQYLWQAAKGQWEIIQARQPVAELLQDESLPAATATRLRYVQEVREYAAANLHLPVNGAYAEYADIGRPYVVWNLFVAPALSMQNHTWCYPIAGCVAYQGYFAKDAAAQAAEDWRSQGYDSYVGGVPAYSTLGWFDDPVLNTFLNYDKVSLAALLFHELAHRQLYIAGDTSFNESWATAIEQEAIVQFIHDLANQGREPDIDLPTALINRYKKRFQDRQIFVQLVTSGIEELRLLYASDLPDGDKQLQKQIILRQLQAGYQQAVQEKRVSERYRYWFSNNLNNAKLLTIANYHQWVPGFRHQIQEMQRDWIAFYAWSEKLASEDRQTRDKLLRQLNRDAKAKLGIAGQINYSQNK